MYGSDKKGDTGCTKKLSENEHMKQILDGITNGNFYGMRFF